LGTSGSFIEDMALATGVSRSALAAYMRDLRGNGLIQKAGRGLAAARIEIPDCVSLLTALLVTSKPPGCSEIVKDAFKAPLQSAHTFFADRRGFEQEQQSMEELIKQFSPLDGSKPETFKDALMDMLAAETIDVARMRQWIAPVRGPRWQILCSYPSQIFVFNVKLSKYAVRRHVYAKHPLNAEPDTTLVEWEFLAGSGLVGVRAIDDRIIRAAMDSVRRDALQRLGLTGRKGR